MAVRPGSGGQLQFYTPAQVSALKHAASTPLDVAIYTLAVKAGPRMDEIRALKITNVDVEVGSSGSRTGYTRNIDLIGSRVPRTDDAARPEIGGGGSVIPVWRTPALPSAGNSGATSTCCSDARRKPRERRTGCS